MKAFIFIILLLVPSISHAFDGKVSYTVLENSTVAAQAQGEYETDFYPYAIGKFTLELGHDFWDGYRVWVRDTSYISSARQRDGGLVGFNPASIKYEVGLRIDIWEGAYIELSHMCWHNIDTANEGGEAYDAIEFGYEFGKK